MASIFYQFLKGAIERNEDHSRVASAFDRLPDEEVEAAVALITSSYYPDGAARVFGFSLRGSPPSPTCLSAETSK